MFVMRMIAGCLSPFHHEFESGLRDWVQSAPPGESRKEAARLIGDCLLRKGHTLNLARHGLTSLPTCLAAATHLHTLWLPGNRLCHFPAAVLSLPQLSELDLSDNRISRLGDEVGQLPALKKLWLDRNPLARLPHGLLMLHQLTKLSAKDCGLVELPARLGDMRSLTELSLSGNALIVLPDSITQLMGLRHLNVSHNHLTELPEGFDAIELAIPSLDLKHNQLLPRPNPQWFAHRLFGEGFKKWVSWLNEIRDYKTPQARGALASRLEIIFRTMEESDSFRRRCMQIACEAAGHCGDRPAWGLNQMDMALENHLATAGKLSEAALFKSARSQYRIKEINRAAQIHIERQRPYRTRDLDPIEVNLALQTSLREILDLPLTTQGMDGFAGTALDAYQIGRVARDILKAERRGIRAAVRAIDEAIEIVLTQNRAALLPPRSRFKVQPLAFSVANYAPWMAHIARRDPTFDTQLKDCARQFEQRIRTGLEWHDKEQKDAAMFIYNHGVAYRAALEWLRMDDKHITSHAHSASLGASSSESMSPTTPKPKTPDIQNAA
jgi:hypothetical protein